MAYLILDRTKLQHNYDRLDKLFTDNGIEWAIVSKLLCGNDIYLREVIRLGHNQLCDARISHLKSIKALRPEIETIYIKPPPPRIAAAVVRHANISINTQYRTLRLLSEEAVKQQKTHKVIIAVELGERREGVMRTHIADFYKKIHTLPGIRIIGLGTNFACLSGVRPSQAKFEELAACRQEIADRHGVMLPCISGGSSIAIPLLLDGEIPAQINHFRIGETLFFGTDVYNNGPLPGMHEDVITLYAQIIELTRKPATPDGDLGANLEGHTPEFDPNDRNKISWRAILDVGLLDVEIQRLTPKDPKIECIGASSDMLIIDLGSNPDGYRTGDYIEFKTDYMGALRLMHSRYIEKRVAE